MGETNYLIIPFTGIWGKATWSLNYFACLFFFVTQSVTQLNGQDLAEECKIDAYDAFSAYARRHFPSVIN